MVRPLLPTVAANTEAKTRKSMTPEITVTTAVLETKRDQQKHHPPPTTITTKANNSKEEHYILTTDGNDWSNNIAWNQSHLGRSPPSMFCFNQQEQNERGPKKPPKTKLPPKAKGHTHLHASLVQPGFDRSKVAGHGDTCRPTP